MTTTCYALVRGSALRVTGLTNRGAVPDTIAYCTSRNVAKITVNEVSESASNETLRNESDELRIFLPRPAETIRYTADIEFSNTDPGIIGLLSGNPAVVDASGDTVGFDAKTRLPAVSFAMELWSRIAGQACQDNTVEGGFGEVPFGEGPFGIAPSVIGGGRQYGYTLFPFLKGGVMSGFSFSNGKVTFTLSGAQVQRGSKWGSGPYELTGEGERLFVPVSRNTQFRQVILRSNPPDPSCGVQTFTEDIIDGGSAASTSADIIDGGSAAVTSDDIIDGGNAA